MRLILVLVGVNGSGGDLFEIGQIGKEFVLVDKCLDARLATIEVDQNTSASL
jgi:hypothetical protein